MKKQVARLANGVLASLLSRLSCRFHYLRRFFHDLGAHSGDTTAKQLGGVRSFGHLGNPLVDLLHQSFEHLVGHGSNQALGVAGSVEHQSNSRPLRLKANRHLGNEFSRAWQGE
jgi:hypothetical protein